MAQAAAKLKSIFADEIIDDMEEGKDKPTEMAEATVADTGIIVRAESWEPGQPIVAVDGENEVPMPEGSYVLDNGATLLIDENSTITEVIEAEVEVEVENKEDKKEDMKAEPKFVTEEDFTAAMSEITKTLERMSVKMSAVLPEKKETDSEKVLAENKLLKQRLSEKKKAIADKKEDKPKDLLPENFGQRTRKHVNTASSRAAANLADFNFSQTTEAEDILAG